MLKRLWKSLRRNNMDERLKKILNLVKEGKISPQDADNLISALYEKNDSENGRCYLSIKVLKDDNKVVNIKLPIKFVKFMTKASGKLSFDIQDDSLKDFFNSKGIKLEKDGRIVDFEAFSKAIDELCNERPINIVDIDAEDENGENVKVKISVE